MANSLTGDFDVVAEFAVPTANRLLAAMHRCERLLHSITARVDDNPPRGFPGGIRPVFVGSVDTFGDPTVNHQQVGRPNALPGALAATDPIYAGLGGVVVNLGNAGIATPPIVPSHLQGVVQAQLAPPTVEVPDTSGTNIKLRLPVRARYLPDPGTSPVAEFIRGEVQITTAITQVVSQKLFRNYVDVNLQSADLNINFVSFFPTNLSAEDLAGINLLIRNALRTSFLPSTERLPDQIAYLHIKPLHGPPGAIAALLKMANPDPTVYVGDGNPATVNSLFVGAGDDFAFAVGRDFLLASFNSVISKFKSQPIPPVSASQWPFGTAHYTITIDQVTVDLRDPDPHNANDKGKIVVTITGSAVGDRGFPWPKNFSFTAQLDFTLLANGDTVDLVAGDVSANTTDWRVNTFGNVAQAVQAARDAVLNQRDANGQNAYDKVNQMFSANTNLGKFLSALLNPANPQPGVPPPQDVFILLWYNAVEITSQGVVLHGSLAVGDWPAAHVEYEPIPAKTSGAGAGGAIPHGPDYSALKTWIPGGTIDEFDWSYQGQAQPFLVDVDKFVLLDSGPQIDGAIAFAGSVTGVVSGYTTLCLTIKGTRLSSSGPVVAQPVTASVCGYNRFPIIAGTTAAANGALAMVALTQPGPDGMIRVMGHAPALADRTGQNTPNLIVHFADAKSSNSLSLLTQALAESGRSNAAVAFLAVMSAGLMSKTRHAQGIVYSDTQGGIWERVFGVQTATGPLTLIIAPNGKKLWLHEGELDSKVLAAALKNNLVGGGIVKRGLFSVNVRIGRQPPDFQFPLTAGHSLTLRKTAGREVILAVWQSTLMQSIEAVKDLQAATDKAGAQGPLLLAINDGETPDIAINAAKENGITATLVTDPQRMISSAYGVKIWPTIIYLDKSGVTTGIRYGRTTDYSVGSPAGGRR